MVVGLKGPSPLEIISLLQTTSVETEEHIQGKAPEIVSSHVPIRQNILQLNTSLQRSIRNPMDPGSLRGNSGQGRKEIGCTLKGGPPICSKRRRELDPGKRT